jgi:hypothetical protein
MLQDFSRGGFSVIIRSAGSGELLGLVPCGEFITQFKGVRLVLKLLENSRRAIFVGKDAVLINVLLVEVVYVGFHLGTYFGSYFDDTDVVFTHLDPIFNGHVHSFFVLIGGRSPL